MVLKVIGGALSNPIGTARILEAHSTLRRARDAGLSYGQIRAVFPDAARYTEAQLDGFMLIGADLATGRVRFSGRLLPDDPDGLPDPA